MESIGIVLNTIAANMRTEGLLEQSQLLTSELQAQQEELKKTNDRLELQAASLRQSEELLTLQAGRTAADQRRAGGQGGPAVGPEQAGGSQEHRGRAGQGGAGGEGRTAGPDLQVQVRVPGQYEPRAAHAAQQPADPVQDAQRERAGQSERQAGGVRPQHPQRRRRPAGPDQRHPGPVEDRERHGHPRHRRDVVRQPPRPDRPDLLAAGPGQEAGLRRSTSTRPCRARCTPTTSACSR